jgi:hypothetical protein
MLSSLRPQIAILTRHVFVDVEQCWTHRPATAVLLLAWMEKEHGFGKAHGPTRDCVIIGFNEFHV